MRKFPVVPIIAAVLKVVAVSLLLMLLAQAIQQFGMTFESWSKGQPSMYGMASPAIKGFLPRLQSLFQPMFTVLIALLVPSLTWGFSDLFLAARELEYHRRLEREARNMKSHEADTHREEPVAIA